MALSAIVLLISLAIGVPVAFALGLTGLIYLITTHAYPSTVAAHFFGTLNSSGLLAIPFFILAASIMSRGGATRRLVNVIDALFGHYRGGLPLVSVITAICFSAICGSSVATAAAIGVVLIPEMLKRGYNKTISVGLIATAGGLGILIPPSVPLIVYGIITEQSIAKLFMAGMIPGLILGTLLAIVAYYMASRSDVPSRPRFPWDARAKAIKEAIGVLVMPVMVLGGIYSGLFIPTEAAAIAAIYALALTRFAYRVPWRNIFQMLTESAATATMILFILVAAQLLSYTMTAERIPHYLFDYVTMLNLTPALFLLIVMVFYLFCGMFLEIISIIIITMPIVLPILYKMGIDPIHFGIILTVNMELAVITPPIGLNLFIISGVSKVPVLDVFRATMPWALCLLLFLILITFVPGIGSLIASVG